MHRLRSNPFDVAKTRIMNQTARPTLIPDAVRNWTHWRICARADHICALLRCHLYAVARTFYAACTTTPWPRSAHEHRHALVRLERWR